MMKKKHIKKGRLILAGKKTCIKTESNKREQPKDSKRRLRTSSIPICFSDS